MKKLICLVFLCVSSANLFCQQNNLLDYDACKDEIDQVLQKKYLKAVKYYNDKKFKDASSLLMEIIHKNEDFASAYFLMGMIGVVSDNTTMIVKYFNKVRDVCPEFQHPYYYYYIGLVDYSFEKYSLAIKDFETFLSLTEGNNYYDSLQNAAINYIDWSEFLSQTIEHPVDFKPKKIPYLQQNKNYFEPFISWDKQEIYFIREEVTKDTNRDTFLRDITTRTNYYMEKSLLDTNGFYDKGFILQYPFNNNTPEGRVSITADNKYLFFCKKMQQKDNNTWDIFYCENIDGQWSTPKSVNINTNEWDERNVSISACGNTLYFASNRQGTKGGYDIWYAKRIDENTFSSPINMGDNVNTSADETFPFISADDMHLYFLSEGRKTIGMKDIFFYDLTKGSAAINIGYPINTEQDEHCLGIMLDGQTAYTVYKKPEDKYQQIITFTLPEKVRSQKREIKHVEIDAQIEMKGEIALQDLTTNDVKTYFFSSSDNDCAFILKPSTPYLLTFNKKGYMFFAQIIDSKPSSDTIIIKPLQSLQEMQIKGLQWVGSTNILDDNSNALLDSFVEFLKVNRGQRIILKSNARMIAYVTDYLLKSGISEDRISKQTSNNTSLVYQIK